MSYGGAFTIKELQETAESIELCPVGERESRLHDVTPV
jgi:hypothetical protein